MRASRHSELKLLGTMRFKNSIGTDHERVSSPARFQEPRAERPAPGARRTLARAMAITSALLTLSCGKLGRLEECREFARTVNPVLDGIETSVSKESAAALNRAAVSYEKLAEAIRKRTHSPHGQPLFLEYADFLSEVVPALRAYASAVERADEREKETTRRNLRRIKRREQPLLKRLASYCHGG